MTQSSFDLEFNCCHECGEGPLSGAKKFCCRQHQNTYNARKRRNAKAKVWLRKNRYNMPVFGFPDKECEECGATFTPKSSKHRFCKKICRGRWSRKHKYGGKYTVRSRGSSAEKFIKSLLSHYNRRETLTDEFVFKLFEEQKGKCALSGKEMTYLTGEGYVPTNISIDKIDPENGYVEGNVQLVCRKANEIKRSSSDEELIEWCEAILSHKKNKNGNARDNRKKNLRVTSKSKNRGRK